MVKNIMERQLDQMIAGLNVLVDRVFRKHAPECNTCNSHGQSDRNAEANRNEHPALASVLGETVRPCPVCGTISHNWAIHEEWRHLPGAKCEDKVAADLQAFPAHECADRPHLPCPACLKWTGDAFATVKSNFQCFPGIDITEL
jgi:hypothetical protein